MDPRATLTAFDHFLFSEGVRGDLLMVGGAALALLGLIQRATRDCDVLEPLVDPTLDSCARRFADLQTAAGSQLDPGWLNNGPASLVQVLPTGWRDRSIDVLDCVAMAPTAGELRALRPWLAHQDANPQWPEHVDAVMADLAQRCGHGL